MPENAFVKNQCIFFFRCQSHIFVDACLSHTLLCRCISDQLCGGYQFEEAEKKNCVPILKNETGMSHFTTELVQVFGKGKFGATIQKMKNSWSKNIHIWILFYFAQTTVSTTSVRETASVWRNMGPTFVCIPLASRAHCVMQSYSARLTPVLTMEHVGRNPMAFTATVLKVSMAPIVRTTWMTVPLWIIVSMEELVRMASTLTAVSATPSTQDQTVHHLVNASNYSNSLMVSLPFPLYNIKWLPDCICRIWVLLPFWIRRGNHSGQWFTTDNQWQGLPHVEINVFICLQHSKSITALLCWFLLVLFAKNLATLGNLYSSDQQRHWDRLDPAAVCGPWEPELCLHHHPWHLHLPGLWWRLCHLLALSDGKWWINLHRNNHLQGLFWSHWISDSLLFWWDLVRVWVLAALCKWDVVIVQSPFRVKQPVVVLYGSLGQMSPSHFVHPPPESLVLKIEQRSWAHMKGLWEYFENKFGCYDTLSWQP